MNSKSRPSHIELLRRIAALTLLAGMATGCILFPSAKDKALRKSPSFQAGYSDGCAAASATGANYREAPYRDDTAFKSDDAYRAGWTNGFQTCRPSIQGAGAPPGASPIPSFPGH